MSYLGTPEDYYLAAWRLDIIKLLLTTTAFPIIQWCAHRLDCGIIIWYDEAKRAAGEAPHASSLYE